MKVNYLILAVLLVLILLAGCISGKGSDSNADVNADVNADLNSGKTVSNSSGKLSCEIISPISVLIGSPANFSFKLEGGEAESVEWSFGGEGEGPSNIESPSFKYKSTGKKSVSLMVTTSSGEKVECNVNVNSVGYNDLRITKIKANSVKPVLSLTASATSLNGVAPLTVEFDATAVGGIAPTRNYTFNWLGDLQENNIQNPSKTFSVEGTYAVVAEVFDEGVPQEFEFDVEVEGGLAQYSGGKPVYRYAWTFGDGGTSNEKSPKHFFNKKGQFPVTIKVTDELFQDNFDAAEKAKHLAEHFFEVGVESQRALSNKLNIVVGTPPIVLTEEAVLECRINLSQGSTFFANKKDSTENNLKGFNSTHWEGYNYAPRELKVKIIRTPNKEKLNESYTEFVSRPVNKEVAWYNPTLKPDISYYNDFFNETGPYLKEYKVKDEKGNSEIGVEGKFNLISYKNTPYWLKEFKEWSDPAKEAESYDDIVLYQITAKQNLCTIKVYSMLSEGAGLALDKSKLEAYAKNQAEQVMKLIINNSSIICSDNVPEVKGVARNYSVEVYNEFTPEKVRDYCIMADKIQYDTYKHYSFWCDGKFCSFDGADLEEINGKKFRKNSLFHPTTSNSN